MNGDREIRDLAALDPRTDPQRWESMVEGINRAAAAELAHRSAAREPGVLYYLARWRTPTAALCGAIAAGGAAIVVLNPSSASTADGGLANALGYPPPVAEWVVADVPPSVEELVLIMEGLE